MSALSQIDVSYGAALLPTPLKRLVGKDGKALNIQPVASGQPVYIWAAQADAAEAVLEVAVLVDDEAVPAGFKKVTRDLSAGTTRKRSFLAYRLGVATEEQRPIGSIAVLADGEVPGKFNL